MSIDKNADKVVMELAKALVSMGQAEGYMRIAADLTANGMMDDRIRQALVGIDHISANLVSSMTDCLEDIKSGDE